MNHNLNVMDADDMQFCPYLVPDSLPSLLKDCLTKVKNPNEQDILLLSLLTASSACLPNVVFRYGHTGKEYHPNLQTFIMAGAASGKLLVHAADAYQQIEDSKVAAVPSSESALQKVTLFALLPECFTTSESYEFAKNIGVCDRTIKRWLLQWTRSGKLTHVQHGMYKKVS